MNTQQAYDKWSEEYDTNINRTRDLEGIALQSVLNNINAPAILEAGCGTGKNTQWLCTKATYLVATDFSAEMIAKAKEKVSCDNVQFVQADLNKEWVFTDKQFDLITFSLVLEHIENLDFIFRQAKQKLKAGGLLYIGELHPFKQYAGSKARFNTGEGTTVLQCYTHNISDFVQAAKRSAFTIADVQEFFDDADAATIPRILTLVFTVK